MRLRCSYAGHTFDASRPEGARGASGAVGAGTVGNWRAENEEGSARTRRLLSPARRANPSRERLPLTTALRLPLERSLQLLRDFFPPGWLCCSTHGLLGRR